MIIQIELTINGIDYIHTVSDAGRYIERGGYRFEEAYDKAEFHREYTEGDLIVREPDNLEVLDEIFKGYITTTLEHARKLRELITKSASSLSDTDALDGNELFDPWAVNTDYSVDTRVRYEGTLYKCLLAHTSQPSWTPDVSPSLWVRVDDPSIEWPEWIQPTGATDAYPMGAKVSHNDKHWISDINANVYEPGVYGWHEA